MKNQTSHRQSIKRSGLQLIASAKRRLGRMSFRTGVIVAVVCACCYGAAFAQLLLPISASAKWWLWFTFYGLAKTCQYTAIAIIGKSGFDKLRQRFGLKRKPTPDIE